MGNVRKNKILEKIEKLLHSELDRLGNGEPYLQEELNVPGRYISWCLEIDKGMMNASQEPMPATKK